MKSWWRDLLGLCTHKWKFVREVPVYAGQGPGRPVAFDKECVCEHCGKWKAFRL